MYGVLLGSRSVEDFVSYDAHEWPSVDAGDHSLLSKVKQRHRSGLHSPVSSSMSSSPSPDYKDQFPAGTLIHPAFQAAWVEMMTTDTKAIAPPWNTTADIQGGAEQATGKFQFNYPRLPIGVIDPTTSKSLQTWLQDNGGKYSWIGSGGKYNGTGLRTNKLKPKSASSSDPYMSPWTDINDSTPRAALHPLTGTCMEIYNPLVPAASPRNPEQEQKSMFMCYANEDDTVHNGLMCPIPQSGSGGYNQSCYAMWEASTGKSAMDNCNQWLQHFYSDPDNSDITSPAPTLCSDITLADSCWEDNVTTFTSSGTQRAGTPTTCTFPYLLTSTCPSQESCSLFTPATTAAGTCQAFDTLCGACTGDKDCPSGQLCNPATKRCEAACDLVTCPAGKKCKDGVCQTVCGHQTCSADEKCCNIHSSTPSCVASSGTCPTNACAKSNCNPTTSDHCNPTTGDCECGDGPACTHGNQCTHGGCSCGGGPPCLGSQDCLIHPQTQTYACGTCSTKCTNGNMCTTDGKCVCGTGTGCTGDSQCENGICKKVTPGGTPGSNTSTTSSKSHTTRNVIIAVVVTIVVIVAIVLGVYFGLKHKHAQHKALV